MATALKILAAQPSYPDLGDLTAIVLDNGKVSLAVDNDIQYGLAELQDLKDAIDHIMVALAETIPDKPEVI